MNQFELKKKEKKGVHFLGMPFNFLLCSEWNLDWIQSNCTKRVNPRLSVERMWFAYVNANDLYLSNIQLEIFCRNTFTMELIQLNKFCQCLLVLRCGCPEHTGKECKRKVSKPFHPKLNVVSEPDSNAECLQSIPCALSPIYTYVRVYIGIYRYMCRCSRNTDILCSAGLIMIF